MASQLYTNNASTTLGFTCGDNDTSVATAPGGGAKLASPTGGDWQILTFVSPTDPTLFEIVKLTGRTGDSLTIERGQEGTGGVWPSLGLVWLAGTLIESRLTAGMLERLSFNAIAGGAGISLLTTKSSDEAAVVIGANAEGPGMQSTAIGYQAAALGLSSVAIGNARAHAANSVALGNGSAWRPRQFATAEHPCVPRDDYWAGYGSHYNSGMEAVFASQFVELGTPASWTANTEYPEGATVRPTTPNGFQYYLWHGAYDPAAALNVHNSGPTEPIWPASVEGAVGVGSTAGSWLALNPLLGVNEVIPEYMVFYPTEVGFICFNHSGVTAAPFVSIGTPADPTLFVNNQQLSGITGAQQRHVFTGQRHGLQGGIRYTLVTAATGAAARFHGRFYAKGIFIQTQG